MTRPTLSARDLETQDRTAGHTVRRSAQGMVVEGREGRGEHLSAERQLSAVQGPDADALEGLGLSAAEVDPAGADTVSDHGGSMSKKTWRAGELRSIAEQGGLVVKAGAKHYKVSKKSGEWVTQIPFGNPELPKGTAHSIIQALRRAGIKLLLLLVVIGGMLGYWWLA